MSTESLLEKLRARRRPSWEKLQPLLAPLDEADAAALEPELARWSDEERTFPVDIWEKGASIPKAAKLFRHLDLRGPPVLGGDVWTWVPRFFERLMLNPAVHHVSSLSLGDMATHLTGSMLAGFRNLRTLSIRTRDAYFSAIRDAQCEVLAQSPALSGLTSLNIEYCDIRSAGVAALVSSPYLHSLQTLELYVPSRPPALRALAEGSDLVLSGLTTLGLGGEHLSAEGVEALCAASDLFARLRVLRIFAMDTEAYDWSSPFGVGREKNVKTLATGLLRLLSGFKGLQRLEVLHGYRRTLKVVKGFALRALKSPAQIITEAFPEAMRGRPGKA